MTATEQRLIRQSDVADLVNHTNGQGKALQLLSSVILAEVCRIYILILRVQLPSLIRTIMVQKVQQGI